MMNDNEIERFIKFLIATAVMMFLFNVALAAFGREVPFVVPIRDLAENSTAHDMERVTIIAYARSCEATRGRMGSNYIKCRMGEGDHEINAYADFPLYNAINKRLLIQGTYHHEGRFAGMLADHFIIAETVEGY